MIIVQLKGGLGNQLFQYAAALHLAIHHNVELKVDITELNIPDHLIGTTRDFDLKNLVSFPQIATKEEINTIKGNLLSQYFQKLMPSYKRRIYNEKCFEFDCNFLQAGKEVYLTGYRQSEKYFLPIKEKIYQSFQIQDYLIEHLKPFKTKLKSELSVALHIRRGDYTNNAVHDYHGVLDIDYYQAATEYFLQKNQGTVFYIFSDNIDWVQQNYNFKNANYITKEVSKNAIEDFELIKSCQHQIIANSTFSWWAAYLNPNPNKIVIAPKKWFNSAPNNTKDLFPQDWITI